MDEEAPMSLVDDRFDDVSIDDRPVDDAVSFYNEDDLHEEEIQPTSENFVVSNRYRPSHNTPGQLPTIREEKHDDLRSNSSSRATNTRPSSSNAKLNLSENSHDFSSNFQFQNGLNAIEKFTENFYSKENDAERLFPENKLLQNNFSSPPIDKQNSWEPSVCHYEKQPTPEVHNNSPGIIFAGLQPKMNDENVGVTTATKISPERAIFTTSPMNSTRFLEAKTSTPKRPGASNRLGQRLQPPPLEISTIYALSPQRANVANGNQSRFGSRPTAASQTASDTVLSNMTISDSMVRKVLSGSKVDTDLLSALEMARKKREQQSVKPDFRVRPTHVMKVPAPVPPPVQSVPTAHQPKKSEIKEGRETNKTDNSSDLSRISVAKSMTSSREDLTRSSSKHTSSRIGGFSSSSVNTVLPNTSTSTSAVQAFGGRDSVNSIRTVSRASSTATNNTSAHPKPLKIESRRLAFGTVPIAESVTMELDIENVSDRLCQVRSRIDSTTNVYQILDNKVLAVKPGKSTRLRVAFTPASVGRYQVLLIVEVVALNFVQKIPIWGIGGVAAISPIICAEVQPSATNASEYSIFTPNPSRISFKLQNSGLREGFALISILDTSMRPFPTNAFRCLPARGILLRRGHEKRVDIRIDQFSEEDTRRTSSAMSSVSTSSVQKRVIASGAELVVQIAWGDEVMRQRLKMLETKTGRRHSIDGLDFTSTRFADEDVTRPNPPTQEMPNITTEDVELFTASYRTLNLIVFSSPRGLSAFRSASSASSSSITSLDQTTVLETTAFRHQTFVNDMTVMPRHRK